MKQNSPQYPQVAQQPISPQEPADKLSHVMEEIAQDAQSQPAKYLNETIVPEGGE